MWCRSHIRAYLETISFISLDILIISLHFTLPHYCSNKLAQKIIAMFLHKEYTKQRAIVPGLEGVFFDCFSFPSVFSIETNPECSGRPPRNWEPSRIGLPGCGLTRQVSDQSWLCQNSRTTCTKFLLGCQTICCLFLRGSFLGRGTSVLPPTPWSMRATRKFDFHFVCQSDGATMQHFIFAS